MAEQRKKSMSILLWFPGKPKPTKLEPFPAEQWPDQPGAEPGLFRVRLNGRWLDGRDASGGESGPLFFTWAGVAGLMARSTGDPELASLDAKPPRIRRRQRVRYSPVDPDKAHLSRQTWTMTDPFQALDGRWRCMVVGEPEPVLCDDLEVL